MEGSAPWGFYNTSRRVGANNTADAQGRLAEFLAVPQPTEGDAATTAPNWQTLFDAAGLSFVGAVFDSRIVASVRVISGDTPIGPDDNVKGAGQKDDIVVMDDFIYGEPRAIN